MSELDNYLVIINSPYDSGKPGQPFETDKYGRGNVTVYKVLGRVPDLPDDIGHIIRFGEFQLQSEKNKTDVKLMDEIKKGLVKIISNKK